MQFLHTNICVHYHVCKCMYVCVSVCVNGSVQWTEKSE